ncbi:hypothetical protein GCM10011365_04920 [Marinicella pacifica]|uniref:Uncharacterized protein n=2 Tax=Marinicella pacifica TaxID=1171543 RepID=A0A917FIB6_9GAMM|nr:hypothetical protein GCM10011365_04920 [Marinicella pacifica]
MNNKIIYNTLVILIFTLVINTEAVSQVDSSFTYQGELIHNGSPANGQYDINLDLVDGDLNPWGNTSVHQAVDVVNGVFSVNADFDIAAYDGYKDFTVTVSIRKTSEGPSGPFTTLGSHTVQAVPLATNLTNGGASTGEVLTFNGYQWTPSAPNLIWQENGGDTYYSDGEVGIGTSNPLAKLHVQSDDDTQDPLRVRVDNTTKFWVKKDGSSSFYGDTKQSSFSNGMMKFMVHAGCDSSPTIEKSYNGVTNSTTAPSIISTGGNGRCEISFPINITERYWQASAVYASDTGSPGLRSVSCRIGSGTTKLLCERYNAGTGNLSPGPIMVFIY